jgi:hypothetical protein
MRTLLRILVILIAALSVVGATVAFSQSSLASTLIGAGPGRGDFQQGPPPSQMQGNTAVAPADRGQFPGGPDRGGSGSLNPNGAVPLVKNLAVIGIIVFLLVAMTNTFRVIRKLFPGAPLEQQG